MIEPLNNRLPRFKIVAFGDSLTVGYQSPTRDNDLYLETPYVDFITEKTGDSLEFIVKGISGELTEEMLRRFDEDVLDIKPNYVIILGGTNDIGWGQSMDSIADNLFAMYDMAIKADIVPIAVTVPSIRGFDSLIYPRLVLNDMIKKHCISRNITYVDLFNASAEKDSSSGLAIQRLSEVYSNDGLHLSTAGYRLLGDLLYKEVFEKIL